MINRDIRQMLAGVMSGFVSSAEGSQGFVSFRSSTVVQSLSHVQTENNFIMYH